MDTPQEEEEDTVQPALSVQKTPKKGGVGGAPVTRAVKGGGRVSAPKKCQRTKSTGKKAKKGKDGGSGANNEGTSGGEEEATGPAVGRPTRQTKHIKCTSKIQPPPTLQTSSTDD